MKQPIPEIRWRGRHPYIIDTDFVEVRRATVRYAEATGKSVSGLSEAEKKQAWLEHILEKYGS